ncbi:MAG: periplasmic heavy metal sensor [Myxococcales bacterium]|nr:periplasmic heavy metal sensor [Myxococcales bacterium]
MNDPVNATPATSDVAKPPPSRRRRRTLRVALGVLLLGGVFVAGSAFADRGRHHSPEAARDRASWMVEKMLDRIDGTDEQIAAMEAIVDQHFEAAMAFKKEGGELRMKFAQALLADNVDRRQVEALRKQALDFADRVSARGIEALTQASATLTPVQKQELLEKVQARFEGHFGH